jgi:predicted alpha/beta-hydrolase family hydrolase
VRTAAATGADAVIALAFPLHPPGRPDKDRGAEARGAERPLLVVQGERDPFGTATEVALAVPGATVRAIPAADHGFAVPKKGPLTQGEALELITDAVAATLAEWVPAASR